MDKDLILLVEDDEKMAMGLKFNLNLEDWDVDHVISAEDAMELIPKKEYGLIILDIMLPGMPGTELLKMLRGRNKTIPIIIISAKNASEDIIDILKIGADDYITKPFDLNVFLAKVSALMRSRKWLQEKEEKEIEEFRFGNCWIDFTTSKAGKGDETFSLSYKELKIMEMLIQNVGQPVSRDEFWKEVWGVDEALHSRAIDNFMYQLRKRFEDDTSQPKHILKAHGKGYRFVNN